MMKNWFEASVNVRLQLNSEVSEINTYDPSFLSTCLKPAGIIKYTKNEDQQPLWFRSTPLRDRFKENFIIEMWRSALISLQGDNRKRCCTN